MPYLANNKLSAGKPCLNSAVGTIHGGVLTAAADLLLAQASSMAACVRVFELARFPTYEGQFSRQSPMVPSQSTIRPYHTMARHHERQRILAHRCTHRARSPLAAHLPGDLPVTDRLAHWDC